MTICGAMLAAIDKKLQEKKSLEEIGEELCDSVDDPRGKAIRIIKSHRGEKFLKDNAEWLGYNDSHIKHDLSSKKFDDTEVRHEFPPEPEPIQTQTSDEFEEDEVVYEEPLKMVCNIEQAIPQLKVEEVDSYIPTLLQVKKCPGGCGYGYCEQNKKWYNQMQMAQLDD